MRVEVLRGLRKASRDCAAIRLADSLRLSVSDDIPQPVYHMGIRLRWDVSTFHHHHDGEPDGWMDNGWKLHCDYVNELLVPIRR